MCSFGFGHPLKTSGTKNLDFALTTHCSHYVSFKAGIFILFPVFSIKKPPTGDSVMLFCSQMKDPQGRRPKVRQGNGFVSCFFFLCWTHILHFWRQRETVSSTFVTLSLCLQTNLIQESDD